MWWSTTTQAYAISDGVKFLCWGVALPQVWAEPAKAAEVAARMHFDPKRMAGPARVEEVVAVRSWWGSLLDVTHPTIATHKSFG